MVVTADYFDSTQSTGHMQNTDTYMLVSIIMVVVSPPQPSPPRHALFAPRLTKTADSRDRPLAGFMATE